MDYNVTLWVTVFDEERLLMTARNRAVQSGCEESDIPDVATALRWIFDSVEDASDCGVQVNDSGADAIAEIK